MKSEITLEVIKRLNGSIHAVGSCEIDKERYDNLKNMDTILWHLVNDVIEETQNHDSYMGSVSLSGNKAIETLKDLKEMIDDTLREVGELDD